MTNFKRENLYDFLHALSFLAKFAYSRCKVTNFFLFEQCRDRVTIVKVRKALLSDEPATLDEAERLAQLKEVFSDDAVASVVNVLALGLSSTGSYDIGTQTYANGTSYNSNVFKTQLWQLFNGKQKRANCSHFPRPPISLLFTCIRRIHGRCK